MGRPDSNPKSAFGITKPPMHLIPGPGLLSVAMVMRLGAEKYGPYNWRDQSVAASVYVSAAERHLRAWFDGEDTDPESGQSHLGHVAACMLILLDAMQIGRLVDDRPPAAPTGQMVRDMAVKPKTITTGPPIHYFETQTTRTAPLIDNCPDCGHGYDSHAIHCRRLQP